MKLFLVLLLLLLAGIVAKSLLFSFRSQSPDDYAQTGPAFVLQEHLSGSIVSEGLIYGPTGKVSSRFTAEMTGEWDGNTGILSEKFRYATGREQQRKWFLTAGPGNTFTATADDIVGVAQGVVSGSTASLTYKLVLPDDAGGYTLSVTDWMYLTENGVILNKSEMRMFGIKVAELIATMRPR